MVRQILGRATRPGQGAHSGTVTWSQSRTDRVGITGLLDADFEDPGQRLALQFACRARLLG